VRRDWGWGWWWGVQAAPCCTRPGFCMRPRGRAAAATHTHPPTLSLPAGPQVLPAPGRNVPGRRPGASARQVAGAAGAGNGAAEGCARAGARRRQALLCWHTGVALLRAPAAGPAAGPAAAPPQGGREGAPASAQQLAPHPSTPPP
jgi:hypothetical protein